MGVTVDPKTRFTVMPAWKPAPVTVTNIPPVAGPVLGETPAEPETPESTEMASPRAAACPSGLQMETE